jgi:hypothetical protein
LLYSYVGNAPTTFRDPSGFDERAVVVSSGAPTFDVFHWKLANWMDLAGEVHEAGPGTEEFVKAIETAAAEGALDVLHLSGHGAGGEEGVGVTTVDSSKAGAGSANVTQNSPQDIMDRISAALSDDATVWLCSCGSTDRDKPTDSSKVATAVQKFANKLNKQIAVCACTGPVSSPCTCRNSWVCRRSQ